MFDYSPLKYLNEPTNIERFKLKGTTRQISDKTNEVTAETVKLLRGPRHDEFDWNLTKVSD